MSFLDFAKRPMVIFDVNNRDHRKMFAKYIATKTWKECPVRFGLPDDQGHTYNTIQNRLTEWYLTKEFGKFKVDKKSK